MQIKQHMHGVKTSSPLLDCRANHSLVKFIIADTNCACWRSSYKVKVAQGKSFFSKLCVALWEW